MNRNADLRLAYRSKMTISHAMRNTDFKSPFLSGEQLCEK
jgi:hypothetical protein